LASSWPVSGGPFVFKTWTRGLQIVYERNPRAWERVPALDRIRVEFVPDVVTAFQLLERGEIDALGPYPGVDMQRRGALVPAGVTSDIGATWAGAFLNVRTARLADARVRRALALSIDRRAIALGLVRDEGELLNDLAPIGSGAFASLKPDLGEAKRLLEAAGWALSSSGVRRKAGRELSFTFAIVGADQLPSRISHALHAQAERAGFDLNEVSLEADRFWRDWLRGSRFEAAFLVVRDPGGGALRARFGSRQGGNFSKLADPTLDRLLASADGSLESPSLEQVAQRLAALVPAIPLYRMRVVLIAGLHARGLQANASADGFLWNAAEWSRAA
jgi:peptide/nickel transport system substrate-binding protein